jgi:hypothetical protein
MNKFSKGLHQAIEQKAKLGTLRLSELRPNSREIAQRLIAEGRLIKSNDGKGFVWHEVSR